MSRKARADRSDWHTASVYAFRVGYGPFKIRQKDRIESALVVLKHFDTAKKDDDACCPQQHPVRDMADEVQEILFRSMEDTTDNNDENQHRTLVSSVIVVDIRTMFPAADSRLHKYDKP